MEQSRPRARASVHGLVGPAASVAAVGALVIGLGGCSQVTHGYDPADKWNCSPAQPTVTPQMPRAGDIVRVSSGAAHCARGLPDGTAFRLYLRSEGADAGSDGDLQSEAPVRADGSFDVSFVVPAEFPTGPASLMVDDYMFVPCHDTGLGRSDGIRLASCAAHETRLRISPASGAD